MEVTVRHHDLSVDEYQSLRSTTGWDDLKDTSVEMGLRNSLCSVGAFENDQLIGMGRIVGDGAVYFYVQDVIVLPKYRLKGIGTQIMLKLESWLAENAPGNAFIGLMAAQNKASFYQKFGYRLRDENAPGMFKVIRNNGIIR